MTEEADATEEGLEPENREVDSPPDDDVRHPIGVVSDRTGLSPHVLRAWERRYGVVSPGRTDGGHRLYSDRQVRRLRLLSLLTDGGRQIGRIAELSDGELEDLVAEDRREERIAEWLLSPESPGEPGGSGPEVRNWPGPGELEQIRSRAVAAVERMDGSALESHLRQTALRLGTRGFIEEVAVPLLWDIGERWHRGEIRPAHEHLASAAVTSVLHWLMDTVGTEDDGPSILVGTPPGEQHELGALLVAVTAAAAGWNVAYVGAQLPIEEFVLAARETGVRAVALSCIFASGDEGFGPAIRELRRALPTDVHVIVGGAAAPSADGDAEGVTRLDSLDQLEATLQRLTP